jgi:hypothetical protein
VSDVAGRAWDRDDLRESATRFSVERFRARLIEVMRDHGAR